MARKFYRSGQFMLTMQQLEWLKTKPNASQIIRWLLEIAMTSPNFEDHYDTLVIMEEQIARHERINDKIGLEEWKQRRKNVLAKLI